MLGGLKGFFANQGLGSNFPEIAGWAKQRGLTFKRERDGHGFVVDGALDGRPWRLEWGPPQRPYIAGHELRIRMNLGLPPDLQMMLMSLALKEALEKQAFDQLTQTNQTQINDATPEELRWLAMFPKIAFGGSRVLRASFGGVASLPHEGTAWIEGTLAQMLERAAGTLLSRSPPFVLMTLRGRAYMRMQLATPDANTVASALALFETAVTQALRLAGGKTDPNPGWNSTANTAWQSLHPGAELTDPDGPGEPAPPRAKGR